MRLLARLEIGVDKFLLKIYKILKSHLEKRAAVHIKKIKKISEEIINNGSEESKRELLIMLREFCDK